MQQMDRPADLHWSRRLRLAGHPKIVMASTLVLLLGLVLVATRGGENLSLRQVQQGAEHLHAYVEMHYLSSVLLFIGAYILLTLWLPAAAVLTLLAGFLFGTLSGILYVAMAALTTAMLTFLISRYLAGRWIQKKWKRPLAGFNEHVALYGAEFLILVRLIPMTPFTLVNVLAGMTEVSIRTFAWTSLVGILPGIVLFCYIGRRLLDLESIQQTFSWKIMSVLILLCGIVLTVFWRRYSRLKKNKVACIAGPCTANKERFNVA